MESQVQGLGLCCRQYWLGEMLCSWCHLCWENPRYVCLFSHFLSLSLTVIIFSHIFSSKNFIYIFSSIFPNFSDFFLNFFSQTDVLCESGYERDLCYDLHQLLKRTYATYSTQCVFTEVQYVCCSLFVALRFNLFCLYFLLFLLRLLLLLSLVYYYHYY